MSDCLTDYELFQMVRQPTFGNNILDLELTNDPARIYQITHGPPTSHRKKDRLHCTLTWDFTLKSEKNTLKVLARRNNNKGCYKNFAEIISKSLCLSDNPDEAYKLSYVRLIEPRYTSKLNW